MTTLVITNSFVAGTVIDPNQMNTNFTDITTWANGNIDNSNIKANAGIVLSKIDKTSQYLGLMTAGSLTIGSGTTGDTQPRVSFTSDGGIKFGAGGGSSVDLLIKREDANTIAVRDAGDSTYKNLKAATTTVTGLTITGGTQGSPLYVGGSGVVSQLTPTASGIFFSFGSGVDPGLRPYWAPSPGHRLTLETGVAVSSTDQSAKGTLYFTPYIHNRAWLKYNDGTSNIWRPYEIDEISLSLTLTSGSVYDVFLAASSATAAAIETLVWTNTSTRATGLAVDADTGMLIKSGDASKLYVGTVYATGTNQTTDSAATRGVWNMYNRVPRELFAHDSSNTWTYATATWRGANGLTSSSADGTTNKFSFVIGVAGQCVAAQYVAQGTYSALSTFANGIAMDSTTATAAAGRFTCAAGGYVGQIVSGKRFTPSVGLHYIAGLENATAGATATWFGDNGTTDKETRLEGEISN